MINLYLRSEKGAVPIVELILLVLVCAVGGYALFTASQARHAHSQPVKPQPHIVKHSPTPTPTPTPDPYAGWTTYTSKQEGLSFIYPPGWTATSVPPDTSGGDGVNLKGPNGLEVIWDSDVTGIGGFCDANVDPHIIFDSITAQSSLPQTHVLEYGHGTNIEYVAVVDSSFGTLPLKVGDTGDCAYYALFKSKGSQREMSLQGDVSANGLVQPLTASQIQLLTKIMLSAHY